MEWQAFYKGHNFFMRGGEEVDRQQLDKLLAGCPPVLKRQMEQVTLKQGDYLLRAGDPVEWVYILISGNVKAYDYAKGGDIVISYIGSKNREFFGESEAIAGAEQIAYNVVALSECEALRCGRRVFLDWLEQDHAFCLYLLRRQNRLTTVASQYGVASALMSLKARTAQLICEHLQEDGTVDIDKEMLAGILATSIRSTNRVIKGLREEGVLKTEGNCIEVLDRAALEEIVESER